MINKVGAKVNTQTPVSKGKKIGTGIGLAAGTVYAAKNARNTISTAIKEGAKHVVHADGKDVLLISQNKSVAVGVGVLAASVALLTGAGRLIGGVIGHGIQAHKNHKAEKALELSEDKPEKAEDNIESARELSEDEPEKAEDKPEA